MARTMYRKKNPSVLNILFHCFMVFITSGLWLIWLVVRFLRNNS
jgi:hypothetical protein